MRGLRGSGIVRRAHTLVRIPSRVPPGTGIFSISGLLASPMDLRTSDGSTTALAIADAEACVSPKASMSRSARVWRDLAWAYSGKRSTGRGRTWSSVRNLFTGISAAGAACRSPGRCCVSGGKGRPFGRSLAQLVSMRRRRPKLSPQQGVKILASRDGRRVCLAQTLDHPCPGARTANDPRGSSSR